MGLSGCGPARPYACTTFPPTTLEAENESRRAMSEESRGRRCQAPATADDLIAVKTKSSAEADMRKSKTEIWGVLAILSGPIAAAGVPQALSEGRQILPRTLVPSRYELSLIPNAEALTFKGTVQITGNAPTGGRQMVVNAKGLTFDEVRLDGQLGGTVVLDDKLGRAAISFPSQFAPGRHTLSIAYHGPITTGTVGFFAMDYNTPSGKRRTLAPYFAAAHARRLLP